MSPGLLWYYPGDDPGDPPRTVPGGSYDAVLGTCHISDVDGNNPAMIETVAAMMEVKNLSKI